MAARLQVIHASGNAEAQGGHLAGFHHDWCRCGIKLADASTVRQRVGAPSGLCEDNVSNRIVGAVGCNHSMRRLRQSSHCQSVAVWRRTFGRPYAHACKDRGRDAAPRAESESELGAGTEAFLSRKSVGLGLPLGRAARTICWTIDVFDFSAELFRFVGFELCRDPAAHQSGNLRVIRLT